MLYTQVGDSKGSCTYAKFGLFVVVNCDYITVPEKEMKLLGTLPVGCRPKESVLGMAYPRGRNSCGQITVDSNGEVKAYSYEASQHFGGTVVFPVE